MTTEKSPRLLVVGATGAIGRLAVAAAVRQGFDVRALARDPEGRSCPASKSSTAIWKIRLP